jgi:hypothetical protein
MRPNPLGQSSRNAKGAQTAYIKGQAAARAGQPETVCPYANTPSSPNEVSFGRSWRKKWLQGYRSVKKTVEVPPP